MQRLRAPRTVSPNCRYNASTGRTNLKTIEQRSFGLLECTNCGVLSDTLRCSQKSYHSSGNNLRSQFKKRVSFTDSVGIIISKPSLPFATLYYTYIYIHIQIQQSVAGGEQVLASFPQRTSSSTTSCGRSNFSC